MSSDSIINENKAQASVETLILIGAGILIDNQFTYLPTGT